MLFDTNAFVVSTPNNFQITAKDKTVFPEEFSIIVCLSFRLLLSSILNAGIDLRFVSGKVLSNFAKILTFSLANGFNTFGNSTNGVIIFLGFKYSNIPFSQEKILSFIHFH